MGVISIDGTRGGPKNDQVAQQVIAELYLWAAQRVIAWRNTHDAGNEPLTDVISQKKHMTQIEFAILAGVSVGCLQGLENGGRQPRDEQLIKIASVLGLTLEQLTARPDTTPESAHAGASDPLYAGLLLDDLEVAHWYHGAAATEKMQVRQILINYYQRAHEALKRKEALRFPTEATFPERRSGIDRRRTSDGSAADSKHERRRENG